MYGASVTVTIVAESGKLTTLSYPPTYYSISKDPEWRIWAGIPQVPEHPQQFII
ncbi:hypothetical protein DPMN_137494 [Dreissena polymorpha]|uniref:Uncharacterized protein n=1 Tax=Dreissena polymorpha TaxID=45954 RepID=A0A9D4G2N4_DREPO|nr:hypothetical protein DPMN_137494 [Dreissena polymorpha]